MYCRQLCEVNKSSHLKSELWVLLWVGLMGWSDAAYILMLNTGLNSGRSPPPQASVDSHVHDAI